MEKPENQQAARRHFTIDITAILGGQSGTVDRICIWKCIVYEVGVIDAQVAISGDYRRLVQFKEFGSYKARCWY